MEDTELQAVVGIVEDDEGSAGEVGVVAAVDQPGQDASVAVGWLVVRVQVEAGIVLVAGRKSEEHVQSVEEQLVEEQLVEEQIVEEQSVEEQIVEEQSVGEQLVEEQSVE